MINFRLLKLSDGWLWLAMGILILIGLLAIFSSTSSMLLKINENPFSFVSRQFASLGVAFVGLIIFSYFDYRYLKQSGPWLYGVMLFLLLLVLFIGGGHAQRWIQIAGFSFQPSELAKIIIIICLAAFFTDHQKFETIKENLWLLGIILVPFLLIFKQPDLGTALVFIAILIGMLMAIWASPKLLILIVTPMLSILCRPLFILWVIYLIAVILALFLSHAKTWDWIMILGINISVGIAMPFIWAMLKGYQRQRIVTFLNPGADPYGAGYHSLQSIIAIGSGGFFGKGFLHGTQTQLSFIPEQFSDFIFSAIGEEFGFIGAVLVVGLFAVMIWRALSISQEASDQFGKLLVVGIIVWFSTQAFVNIGAILGVMPLTGIPLPFISYGGTAMMIALGATGILANISKQTR